MPEPTPPPKPGASLPSPDKKRKGSINEKDAKIMGEMISQAMEEILISTNREQRLRALETGGSYGQVKNAQIQYDLSLEIVRVDKEGRERTRDSNVVITADLEEVGRHMDNSPYNLLSGLIVPSERNRERIQQVLEDDGVHWEYPVILTVEKGKFWVVQPDTGSHVVVELMSDFEATVTRIETLKQLNEQVIGAFKFLRHQTLSLYGVANG